MAPGAITPGNRKMNSSVCDLKEVTQRYVWDGDLRDGMVTKCTSKDMHFERAPQSTELENSKSLPVIDFSLLSTASDIDRLKLVKEIGSAAEHWGFFQVINHEVPEVVIGDMEAHGRQFFQSLPVEVKERAVETDPGKHTYYHGYGGRFQHLNARVPWLEYLGESYHPVNGAEGLLNKIWPGVGNPNFCRAAEAYSEALVKFGRQILELLAEYLNLSPSFFSQHFSDSTRYQAHWRFNHYPACPDPSKTMGLGPHTDPCCITMVKQDDVGGFQLMNGGRWFDVAPVQKSFLVNIGDTLQTWTNGRYKSVLHRALVNEKSERLSIVFPFSPSLDLDMHIPSCLVDDTHPLNYPPPLRWHHLAVMKDSYVQKGTLSSNFGLLCHD